MKHNLPRLQECTASCIHCGKVHTLKLPSPVIWSIGETILPYPGGDNFGRCVLCRKSGLKMLTKPKELKKKPEGWSRIPTE